VGKPRKADSNSSHTWDELNQSVSETVTYVEISKFELVSVFSRESESNLFTLRNVCPCL
jgi:hypothetical protein